MKKTSKRKKFAKILATFLGTSATLIPIAALVSCEQTAKTPVVKEEKKQKPQDPPPPNPQNPKKPGNGGENNNDKQFTPDNEQNIDGVQIGNIKDKEKNIIGKEIKGTLNIDSIKKLIDDLNERQITDIKSDEFKITCKDELFSKNLLEKLAKALSVTKIENITNNGIQNIELDKNATIKTIDGDIALKDITQNTSYEDNITIKQFVNDQIQKTENNSITISGSITSNETEQFSKEKLQNVAKALSVTKIENITNNGIQNIELDKNATIKTIDGNIALKDIIDSKNQEITKIVDYIIQDLKNKNSDFDSSKLKINTFYKKPKAVSTTASISRNILMQQNNNEVNFDTVATPITPTSLKKLKEIEKNGLNNATLNYKDENGKIYINFDSNSDNFFDIIEINDEIENNKKLQYILNNNEITSNNITGTIFLQNKEIEKKESYGVDATLYPTANELVNLIENKKLKNTIIVGKVQVRGDVNELLEYLVDGPKKITEQNDGVIFGKGAPQVCKSNDTWIGFRGDPEKQTKLPANQFIEFIKRSKENVVYIQDAVITNLKPNSKDIISINNFKNDTLHNVTFKNSDLSKLEMYFVYAGSGTLKFEESTLPISMNKTVIGNLILKNSELPQELKNEKLSKMSRKVPRIQNSLKVFNLKLLDQWTKDEIKEFIVHEFAPPKYVGPQAVWDKLRWLYDEKIDEDDLTPVKVHFTNEDLTDTPEENINFTDENLISSINKNKDQYLALLKQITDRSHS